MAELEALTKKRKAAKQNVSRIKNLVTSSMSIAELECRLSLVEAYFKQLLTMQTEIETLNENDANRAEIEDLCITTKAMIIEFLGDNYKRSSFDSSITIPFATPSKLPSIDLPIFTGKYAEYRNFISTFKQFVDKDSTLSPLEKFNHLIRCLDSQAKDTVRAFQVTSENYPKALQRLEERYGNKSLIFLEHVSNLYDLPEIQKPSAVQLRSLVDSSSAIYSSLKSLGTAEEICNAMLIHLISKKADSETQRKWKENVDLSELPTWEAFCKLLERRCQFLESSDQCIPLSNFNNNRRSAPRQQQISRSSFHTQQRSCALCKSLDHWISGCAQFKSMAHEARYGNIKRLGLCLNCLSEGHVVSKCSSKNRCKTCRKAHHTLLHRMPTDTNENSSPTLTTQPSPPSAAVNATIEQSSDRVILATAVILIRDGLGEMKICRALLDSCSQVNLITERFARILNLPKRNKTTDIVGVGGSSSKIKFETETVVRSRYENEEFNINLFITNRVSGYQPEIDVDIRKWNLPTNLDLADENFYQSQSIDVLLGAENFFEILRSRQIKLGPNLPTLQETHFGWVVSGRYKTIDRSKARSCLTITNDCEDENLNLQLERLWSVENAKSSKPELSAEHQACENSFALHVEAMQDGRIQVMLPFKEDPSVLGSSYNLALKRFTLLERRLSRVQQVKEQYIGFMREYEHLGHMTRVENTNLNQPHYYIPHQCVLRPNSTTTKLRVVFDASAKTTSQKSLNDILLTGPTIQDELFILLLRFRLRRYAFTADIVKMYRMVLIHPAHRQFQQILWRESEKEPIHTYQLNTITYGMSASPFLAIRSLQYVADKYQHVYPIGAETVKTQFYVDDLLTGADDYDTLTKIQQETTLILLKGGFELAKIQSNHSTIKSETAQGKNMNLHEPAITSALGITWNPSKDLFLFSFQPKKQYSTVTKRAILSLTSSIFDPIGFVCPILIQPRVLLQDLWIRKIDWDIEVPQNTKNTFRKFVEDLDNLSMLQIPRYVLCPAPRSVQLHGFCDASIRAYGCCIYARVVNKHQQISVNLVTAKCRVAPTKKRTLPQLELCGAHLLSRLYAKISPLFVEFDLSSFLWTDSSVVLQWLNMHSSTLTTFVGNRISEIQEETVGCNWMHVPTANNPADIVSRGCSVSELSNSIWFSGPSFLKEDEDRWPKTHIPPTTNKEVESAIRKTVLQCEVRENSIMNFVERSSSYNKILNVISWLFRFRVRDEDRQFQQAITADKRKNSLYCIIWNIQQEYFADEFNCLEKNKEIKSSTKTLSLFIQTVGSFRLIRVGGRLRHANIPEDRKHPFLLPKNCHFVEVLVRHLHVNNFHAGPKALLAFTRQTFWIIGARNIARKTVRSCTSCIRYRPKLLQQDMGDLPPERVTPARPFERCGVDFCGPIHTYLKIRGKQPYKCYIAIFVCFATKAVHIEAVTDLSTDSFIAALKRLIGRRGLPSDIFCDNATNFVGANTRLADLKQAFQSQSFQNSTVAFCAKHFIKFHFIPPRAPHFGGIWEAAVKSAKGHLYRTLANAKMTFEELTTALVEIEAIMNSRPIAPLSSDPNDFEALTPGHFLVGGPMNAIPEPPVDCHDISHLQRWKRITAAKQQFWKKWSVDYLNDMLQRHRWTSSGNDIRNDTLVLIHEDNLPPQKWATGRVVATHPGKDGRTRVADVRTAHGMFRRPIHKLALLVSS